MFFCSLDTLSSIKLVLSPYTKREDFLDFFCTIAYMLWSRKKQHKLVSYVA